MVRKYVVLLRCGNKSQQIVEGARGDLFHRDMAGVGVGD